jgi:hypothetical protein
MIAFILFLLCTEFVTRCLGGQIQDSWLRPAYHDTITNGTSYDVTWAPDLPISFWQFCSACDTTKVDLCLRPGTNRNSYATIGSKCSKFCDRLLAKDILGGIDIVATQHYFWDVSIDASDVNQIDWILRFIPYQGDCFDDTQQVSSWHFYIEANTTVTTESTSSSSTSSSTTSSKSSSSTPSSSTTSTSSTSTSPPDSASTAATPTTTAEPIAESVPSTSNAGLSIGAKAGIGAGVGLAGLLCVAALVSFLQARKSREHAQSWFSQRVVPEKEMPMRVA